MGGMQGCVVSTGPINTELQSPPDQNISETVVNTPILIKACLCPGSVTASSFAANLCISFRGSSVCFEVLSTGWIFLIEGMLNPLSISLGVTRDSFIGSHPFRFLIGDDKKTFYVHTDLVAQHSSALAALVSGRMAEAKESCAFLEDVDEDTFVRFVEYMYTDDYSAPDPVIVQMASNSTFENGQDGIEETAVDEPQPAPIYEDGWSFGMSSSKKDKKKKSSKGNPWRMEEVLEPEVAPPAEEYPRHECKKDRLWSEFTEKAQVKHHEPWEPRQNEESCEDYTQVFLCHARLCLF
jgi:hypothetical protein